MNRSTIQLLVLLPFSFFCTNTLAFSERLNSLISAPAFEEDSRLSHVIYNYFLTERRAWITANVATSQLRMEGFDASQNASLWVKQVEPVCQRLSKTYESAITANINNLKLRSERLAYADAAERFRQDFESSVFRVCREYKARIENLNNSDVGFAFHLPRELTNYEENFLRADTGSMRSRVLALKDQSAGAYGVRISQTESLQTLLSWYELLGDDSARLNQWQSEYTQTRSGWQRLLKQAAADLELVNSGKLPSDTFAGKQGDELRATISAAISEHYSVNVYNIVLRQSALRASLKRLGVDAHKIIGESYSAIGFYLVIDQGEQQLSSHRGWYEMVEGKGAPKITIYDEDTNFTKPRTDQLVSTVKQLTPAQLRKQKSDQVEANSGRDQALLKAKIKSETEQAIEAAHLEAAQLHAAAEQQIESAEPDSSLLPAGLLGLLIGVFLVLGSIITGSVCELPQRLQGYAKSAQHFIKLKPRLRDGVLFSLALLGFINLLVGVLSLSLYMLLTGLVALLCAYLMTSFDQRMSLGKIDRTLAKLEPFRLAISLLSLVLGLWQILRVI